MLLRSYYLFSAGTKKMVCYYGSWAVYRWGAGKFDVEDIDPHLCTHAIFTFAGIDPASSTLRVLDPYNELYDNYGKGAYLRFTGLKKINPQLKTILAVGGWNEGSINYSNVGSILLDGDDKTTRRFNQCCFYL